MSSQTGLEATVPFCQSQRAVRAYWDHSSCRALWWLLSCKCVREKYAVPAATAPLAHSIHQSCMFVTNTLELFLESRPFYYFCVNLFNNCNCCV